MSILVPAAVDEILLKGHTTVKLSINIPEINKAQMTRSTEGKKVLI